MKAGWILAFGVMIGLLAGGVIVLTSRPERGEPVQLQPAPTAAPIQVHVSGQVQNPGVVQLPSGSRVQAAVEAAGGFAPGADFEALNLAALLVDGQKVVVPALNSETPANSEISQDSRTGSAVLAQDGFPIDLNTADQLTLEKLPGVGPVTAQAIIEYRLKNGPFTTLEDLDEVSGIGPETIEQIKDLVIIQP